MSVWEKTYRKTANRNLVRRCDFCRRKIKKGEVYYDSVIFSKDGDQCGFSKYPSRYCAKCENERKRRAERIVNCTHRITEIHYRYIPGEAVMEPDYEYCVICKKIIW